MSRAPGGGPAVVRAAGKKLARKGPSRAEGGSLGARRNRRAAAAEP